MMKRKIFVCIFVMSFLISLVANAQKTKSKEKKVNAVTLSGSNYEREIAKGVVLVDYWASWCGPCRKLEPILNEVVAESNIKLGKLNVDNYKSFVSKKNISTIPTLILYKEGKEVERLTGLHTKEELLEIIQPYL